MGSHFSIAETLRATIAPSPNPPARGDSPQSDFSSHLSDLQNSGRKRPRPESTKDSQKPAAKKPDAAPDQAKSRQNQTDAPSAGAATQGAPQTPAPVAIEVPIEGVPEFATPTVPATSENPAGAASASRQPVDLSSFPSEAIRIDTLPFRGASQQSLRLAGHQQATIDIPAVQPPLHTEQGPPVCNAGGPHVAELSEVVAKPVTLRRQSQGDAVADFKADHGDQRTPVAAKRADAANEVLEPSKAGPIQPVKIAFEHVAAPVHQPARPSRQEEAVLKDDSRPPWAGDKLDLRALKFQGQPAEAIHAKPSRTTAGDRAGGSVAPSIRSADGDSAATTLARFLMSADETAPRETDPVVSKEPSAKAAPDTPPLHVFSRLDRAAAPAAPKATDVVGQLLASPSSTTDAIAAAARVLRGASPNGHQHVTLQLDPPELGRMRLEVRMQADAMSLRVDVHSHEVARLVESRLGDLQDALASHGLRVERSSVVVRSPNTSDAHTQNGSNDHSASSNSWSSNADGRPSFAGEGHAGSWSSPEGSSAPAAPPADANTLDGEALRFPLGLGDPPVDDSRLWVDLVA